MRCYNGVMKYIIGVDEVGRGPLAGPITLAALWAPQNFRSKLIKTLGGKIKDSKQFSPARRCVIYRALLRLKKEGKIFFSASHVSNEVIDKRGISYATKLAIKRVLVNIKRSASNNDTIRLDGSLKAPEEFKNQKTITGGDGKNIFIACASIVAKVRRDRLMCRLAKKFPNYEFQTHKGYGTALHYKCLKKFGLSEIHRRLFLTRLTKI